MGKERLKLASLLILKPNQVERAGVAGVKGVWCHEAGGARMFNVISIKQAFAGHARQAGFLAASCQSGSYLGRWVVVVDEDVDPTNLFEVVWEIGRAHV